MDILHTGHEAEMDALLLAERQWADKPRAERQIDLIKARLESVLTEITWVGKPDLFGVQRVKTVWTGCASSGAHEAGRAAGSRINIPQGRPVGQSQHSRIVA